MLKKLIQLILSLFKSSPAKKVEPPVTEVEPKKPTKSFKKISILTKTERVSHEFVELKSKNKDLYEIVKNANKFVNENFGKGLVLTHLFRTQKEQDYLYKNNERYKKDKFKSPHQFWQAVDIRSRNFTEDEIKKLVNWFNKNYNKENYYKWTSKCHSVGHGMHFHIQFVRNK